MFKRSIVLRSSNDAREALGSLDAELRNTGLPPETEHFLREQLATTLDQFERQLSPELVRTIKADRVFEGDGYKVTVRVRHNVSGIVERLKSFLGLS